MEEAERREELQALQDDYERVAAELEETNAHRAELEQRAEARIADLTEAIDVERHESARLNDSLAELREENMKLDQNLARVKDALAAALAEVKKIREETARKLEPAKNEIEQLWAELSSRREELEATRKEAAGAHEARTLAEVRMAALEEAVERYRADAEERQAELAQAKEQLDQAAGVAVAAERARQAAIRGAEILRSEAEGAREELTAAKEGSANLKAANADLGKELASMQMDSRSATETARLNLALMEERLSELNAALDRVRSHESMPPGPEAVEDDRTAAIEPPSHTAGPGAPERAGESGAGQPDDGAVTTATVEPDKAPSDDEAALERFRADIQVLNKLEVNTAGLNLFSGIEKVAGGEVRVVATSAWEALPAIGQESYLNSLLEAWVAVQRGNGPAVVRAVDSNGEVLVEKSRP